MRSRRDVRYMRYMRYVHSKRPCTAHWHFRVQG